MFPGVWSNTLLISYNESKYSGDPMCSPLNNLIPQVLFTVFMVVIVNLGVNLIGL